MSIDNRDYANDPGRGVLWLGLMAAVVLSTAIFIGVWIAAGDDEEQADGAADSAQPSVPSDDDDAGSDDSSSDDDTPDEGDTIGRFIADSDDHTLLADAIETTGLSEVLDGDGPFTVFAPTDSDIDETVAAATLANPDADIERTLQFHIVDGTLSVDDLSSVRSVTTLSGDELRIFTLAGGDGLLIHNGVSVGESTEFDNGILYSVSSLLVPTGAAAPSRSATTTTTMIADSDETTTSTVTDDVTTSTTTTSSTTTTAPATGELADLSNLDPIQFPDSSAVIDSGSFATLDRVIDILNANPTTNIEIGGHTDNVGPIGGNIRLSERRANAVRDYLISGGIDASRLTAVGYGPDQPIASNDTAEGRAANRRIEFTVT